MNSTTLNLQDRKSLTKISCNQKTLLSSFLEMVLASKTIDIWTEIISFRLLAMSAIPTIARPIAIGIEELVSIIKKIKAANTNMATPPRNLYLFTLIISSLESQRRQVNLHRSNSIIRIYWAKWKLIIHLIGRIDHLFCICLMIPVRKLTLGTLSIYRLYSSPNLMMQYWSALKVSA